MVSFAGLRHFRTRPAPTGSPSAEALEEVDTIGDQAAEIEQLANELTALIDESRRRVKDGQSSQAAEVEKMRSLMRQIEEKNHVLQQTVNRWNSKPTRMQVTLLATRTRSQTVIRPIFVSGSQCCTTRCWCSPGPEYVRSPVGRPLVFAGSNHPGVFLQRQHCK